MINGQMDRGNENITQSLTWWQWNHNYRPCQVDRHRGFEHLTSRIQVQCVTAASVQLHCFWYYLLFISGLALEFDWNLFYVVLRWCMKHTVQLEVNIVLFTAIMLAILSLRTLCASLINYFALAASLHRFSAPFYTLCLLANIPGKHWDMFEHWI